MTQSLVNRCAKASLLVAMLAAAGMAAAQSSPPPAAKPQPAAPPAAPAAAMPAPAAQPGAAAAPLVVVPAASAAAPAMKDAPAQPKKRRVARRAPGPACEAVNDPWGDLCTIRKHAEVACSDLAAPGTKAKGGRKSAKALLQPPAPARNLRQECLDAYMRNV